MFKFNTIQSVRSGPSKNWTVAKGKDKPLGVLLLALILILYVSGCGLTTAASNKPKPPSNVSSLTISTSTLPPAVVQSTYQASMTASGGKQPYAWSIAAGSLPPGLHLTSSTGTISGMPSQSGTFTFSAQVQDSSSPLKTVTRPVAVTVSSTASPLQITTNSLPAGKVGTAYQATLTASGGTQPYIWSAPSGSLPLGLTLNSSTGVLSGSPTQQGTFNFTIQSTDSASQSATASLSVTVASSTSNSSSLAITTTSLPGAQVSLPYSATLTATGGLAPYTWGLGSSSGPLPAGLTLSATTGSITGTPTTASVYSFTIQVSDSSSPTLTGSKAFVVNSLGVTLDQYGGREDINCANATGWFHTEKIGSRWWLCTPAGNAFFMQGVEQVVPSVDNTYKTKIFAKYGDEQNWSIETNQRLLSWGFNTLATGAYFGSLPIGIDSKFPLDSNGLNSQPVKMPFTLSVRPAFYSMTNPVVGTGSRLLTDPVKNMIYSHSSQYTGYNPPGGIADYYDPNIGVWMNRDFGAVYPFDTLLTSPYANYLIGITVDDADEMFGFSAGPDFPTNPPGANNVNLSMIVATMSPVQTANSQQGWVYTGTAMQTKTAMQAFLSSKYSTVNALNTAWGSNYTTFGSSGTTVTGEIIGTGNGSTLTFTHTLAKLQPSRFSVQILANGTPVAGDTGNGNVFGPTLASGTVSYTTGTLSITFASGNAPAVGASITANYIQNGWEIGTGFLDEDDRPSHQSWMGDDWIYMNNANPNVKADMNAFLGQMAAFYFKTCHDQLKAAFPNILYLGPDSLGTHAVPPPGPVLQAAALYMDLPILNGLYPFTQAEMDYIAKYFGDKPYIGGFYSMANPDSALSAYPNVNTVTGFQTQSARGQAYYNTVQQMLSSATTSAGSSPYAGIVFWEYIDNWSEKDNWGMVTHLDNAYDGHEDTTAAVSCSFPLQAYACGGDTRNYGDIITWLRNANLFWITQ